MKYIRYGILLTILIWCLCACGNTAPAPVSQATGFLPAIPGNYDSIDTAVLVAKNTAEQKLTFLNLELGKYYTLNYDGATTYADRYDQALALAQVGEGAVVDLTFMREQKRLNSLQVSPQSFSFDQVTNLVMEEGGRYVVLQNESYTVSKDAVVFTKDGRGELMDVNTADTLTIAGVGHTIYSVRIEKGHGYLRLEGASWFEGGWIQIGDRNVHQITKDMLLAVPEGSYTVSVSNKGSAGSEDITIAAGQEITLDVSGWVSEPQFGQVVFTVSPDTAKVYIDGEVINASRPQELSYGIHQMVAAAEGYTTISRYIRVAEDKANLNITLEYSGTVSDSAASENAVSDNGASGGIISVEPATAFPTILGEDGASTVSGDLLPAISTTATPTVTPLATTTPTATPMATVTVAPLATVTVTPFATVTPAVTATPAPEATVTVTPSATMTPTPTPVPTGNPNVARPSSVSSNDILSTDGYRVYVDAPAGVEVYKNGAYIGISPLSFEKKQGIYTITLRRDGYQTRSYTIEIDDGKNNVNYSFSELVEIR